MIAEAEAGGDPVSYESMRAENPYPLSPGAKKPEPVKAPAKAPSKPVPGLDYSRIDVAPPPGLKLVDGTAHTPGELALPDGNAPHDIRLVDGNDRTAPPASQAAIAERIRAAQKARAAFVGPRTHDVPAGPSPSKAADRRAADDYESSQSTRGWLEMQTPGRDSVTKGHQFLGDVAAGRTTVKDWTQRSQAGLAEEAPAPKQLPPHGPRHAHASHFESELRRAMYDLFPSYGRHGGDPVGAYEWYYPQQSYDATHLDNVARGDMRVDGWRGLPKSASQSYEQGDLIPAAADIVRERERAATLKEAEEAQREWRDGQAPVADSAPEGVRAEILKTYGPEALRLHDERESKKNAPAAEPTAAERSRSESYRTMERLARQGGEAGVAARQWLSERDAVAAAGRQAVRAKQASSEAGQRRAARDAAARENVRKNAMSRGGNGHLVADEMISSGDPQQVGQGYALLARLNPANAHTYAQLHHDYMRRLEAENVERMRGDAQLKTEEVKQGGELKVQESANAGGLAIATQQGRDALDKEIERLAGEYKIAVENNRHAAAEAIKAQAHELQRIKAEGGKEVDVVNAKADTARKLAAENTPTGVTQNWLKQNGAAISSHAEGASQLAGDIVARSVGPDGKPTIDTATATEMAQTAIDAHFYREAAAGRGTPVMFERIASNSKFGSGMFKTPLSTFTKHVSQYGIGPDEARRLYDTLVAQGPLPPVPAGGVPIHDGNRQPVRMRATGWGPAPVYEHAPAPAPSEELPPIPAEVIPPEPAGRSRTARSSW
jgi:hypothetical protein